MKNLFKQLKLKQNIIIHSFDQYLAERFSFNLILYLTLRKTNKNLKKVLIMISKPIDNNSYTENFIFNLINSQEHLNYLRLKSKIQLVYLETFLLNEKEFLIDKLRFKKYIRENQIDIVYYSRYDMKCILDILNELNINSIAIFDDHYSLSEIDENDVIVNSTEKLLNKKVSSFMVHYLNRKNHLEVSTFNDSELKKVKHKNS